MWKFHVYILMGCQPWFKSYFTQNRKDLNLPRETLLSTVLGVEVNRPLANRADYRWRSGSWNERS
jgi:hypothetical protein